MIGKLAFITDFGAPIPIKVVNGEPLDFDHIPRYGVWRWDGRRYQCSASGDDLAQLQQFYGVPDERIFRIDAAKKLGVV